MAVTLTGSGGLFTRLGGIIGLIKKRRTAAIAAYPTSATSTAGSRTVYALVTANAGNFPLAHRTLGAAGSEDFLAGASAAEYQALRTAASSLLIDTMDADTPLPARTEVEALRELAKQMVAASASVNATTYTVGSPSYGSGNVGAFTCVVSTEATKIIKDRVTFGTKLTDFPCIRPETLSFTCVKDTRNAGAQSGSEVFRVTGERAWPNLDRRWRGGSGTDMMVTMSSANVDGSFIPGQNILTNSDFEVASSNVPVNWALSVGSAPGNLTTTATAYRGSAAVSMVGDGSTLTKLRQITNDTSGTIGRIKPDTLYLIAMAVRDDGTAPGAGVVRLALEDGSGNTLGTNMSVSANITSIGSTYTIVATKVVSPIDIPSTVYATLTQTTAISAGRAAYVDECIICEMPRPAKGGPGICIIPGPTDARYGDTATVGITHLNTGEFNLELDRLFDLYSNGIALPANDAGSETVADSLIIDP